jgi:hypothetical protein
VPPADRQDRLAGRADRPGRAPPTRRTARARRGTRVPSHPARFLLIGAIYLPALVVTGALAALVQLIPFVSSLLSVAGTASGTSLILAVFVGSFSNVAAFITISGVVAEYLRRPGRGLPVAVDPLKAAWNHRRAQVDAFVRSFGFVFVLLVSFIGVPWGIRQLIRYQFVAQAVMYEDRNGRDALARSCQLVRGRWFHTAVVVGALNAAVGIIALVVALFLLIVISGLPLWLFSILVSLVYTCTIPFAAVAMVLLYGDAVAEHDGAEQAEPLAAG